MRFLEAGDDSLSLSILNEIHAGMELSPKKFESKKYYWKPVEMSKFVDKRAVAKSPSSTPPSARAGHSLLNTPRGLYLLGGYDETGPLSDIYCYNSIDARWTKLIAPRKSPLPRTDVDCCYCDGNIYLFGGVQLDNNDDVLIYNDLWVYNIVNMKWVCLYEETPVPERNSYVCKCVLNDTSPYNQSLIIHGGELMQKLHDDTWLYHIPSRNWIEIGKNGPKPCKRSSHSAVYHENTNSFILFGGFTTDESSPGEVIHLNDLWLMRMSDSNCDQWTWSCVNLNGLAPSPRDLPGMVCINDKLLILGGYGLCEDLGVDDDDEDNDEMDEDDDNNIEDAVDTQPSGDSGSIAPSIELPSSDLGGEVAALVQQIDGINISTNEVTEDSMDEEVDDVVVDYLDDCFVIDLNDGVCNEVSLEEVVVSATSDAPSIWPGRRGCKYVHIANTSNHIMSFGGYDGENFYGLTEVIDCTRI